MNGSASPGGRDLFNDGSYRKSHQRPCWFKNGEAGDVVQVGRHTGSGSVVYMVEFALNRVVGCFEHELAPAQSNGGSAMKVMIRRNHSGVLSAYVAKKDLEEPIVETEKLEMWAVWFTRQWMAAGVASNGCLDNIADHGRSAKTLGR